MDESNRMPESPEELLQLTGRLRCLARSILGQQHQAEDIVQDAWATALQDKPRPLRDRTAWLIGVVRRLAWNTRRSDARRREVEQGAARTEATEDPVKADERFKALQALTNAVDDLDEPFRTVTILRFIEELPPHEIARRQDISVPTVRRRIAHALGLLRVRLRVNEQDPDGFSRALLAFAASPSHLHGPLRPLETVPFDLWKGALAMSIGTKTVAIVSATVVLGVILVMVQGGRDIGAVHSASDVAPLGGEVSASEQEGSGDSTETRDAGVQRTAVHVGSGVTEAELPPLIRGRVEDIEGRTIADANVRFETLLSSNLDFRPAGEDYQVSTDEQGAFSLPFPEEHGRVQAWTPSLTTLVPGVVFADSPPDDLVLIVAPRVEYAGVVVSDEGEPMPQVLLFIITDPAFVRSLRERGARADAPFLKASTDEGGQFLFEDVAWTPGMLLTPKPNGYADATVQLPPHSDTHLRIELAPVAPREDSLLGTVVDDQGEAVTGAYVSLQGGRSVRTDRRGRFVLHSSPMSSPAVLLAIAEGHQPARIEVESLMETATASRTKPIVLRLGGLPLTIRGEVHDANGNPVPGAWVWTQDGTTFGMATVRDERGYATIGPVYVEDLALQGDSLYELRQTRTRDDGSFELRGRLPRPYTLHAMHSETMEIVSERDIPGGADDVVMVIPGEEGIARVAGRVVGEDGRPVPGVTVFCSRSLSIAGTPVYAPFGPEGWPTTGTDGRFEFPKLSIHGTSLIFVSESLPAQDVFQLDAAQDTEDLLIRVHAMRRFQIVLRDPGEADSFQVLDHAGRVLILGYTAGWISASGPAMTLIGGISEIVKVQEVAATIVLRKGVKEVRRVPVQLVADTIHTLRL